MIEFAHEHGQKVFSDPRENAAMLVYLFHRSGQAERARQVISRMSIEDSAEDVISHVLTYQGGYWPKTMFPATPLLRQMGGSKRAAVSYLVSISTPGRGAEGG